MPQSPLYTIGYAPHEPESFADILRRHGVTAVADVRSAPYSAYKPEFGRKRLEAWLPEAGIRYVWLGEVLGPRWKDPAVHSGGRPDYELIARHPAFRRGLERLRRIMDGSTTAIMCAEKDPLACHRTILVARHIKDHADIRHILADGSIEPLHETEKRLMALFQKDQPILPGIEEPLSLDDAYRLQGAKMAWKSKSS
jgi:uncharacterized protein (DUF488 family)